MMEVAKKQLNSKSYRQEYSNDLMSRAERTRLVVSRTKVDPYPYTNKSGGGRNYLVHPVPAKTTQDTEEDGSKGHHECKRKASKNGMEYSGPVMIVDWTTDCGCPRVHGGVCGNSAISCGLYHVQREDAFYSLQE